MIKISNICLHQNSIVIIFFKILKIHEIFCENPRIIFVVFYDVHKENMFTINLEHGREAPSKASTLYRPLALTHYTPLSPYTLYPPPSPPSIKIYQIFCVLRNKGGGLQA